MSALEILRADCARCTGLCCVAPTFAASADFAIDKPARRPCPNLATDSRCGIHTELRERGFPGCTVYDCFGAGQRVTAAFGDVTWRTSPAAADAIFTAFTTVRGLHELLWYLTEALQRPGAAPLHAELAAARAETERRAALVSADLELAAHGRAVGALLREASALLRADLPGRDIDHAGADLVGRNLRGQDLRGANLRGALLIGANLSRTDLRGADLTGADLRGASIAGAQLDGALFVTQPQLAAARGDARTTIPTWLTRPPHWPPTSR